MKKLSRSKTVIILALVSFSIILFSFYVNKEDKMKDSALTKNYQDEPEMTLENFQKKVANPNKMVLVYFHASWCVPCIRLKPEIASLEVETKEYCEVLKLDADDNGKIAEYFEINTLPFFVLYKNGKKVWENTGYVSKTTLQAKIEAFRK
jgi:thioredoxin 1